MKKAPMKAKMKGINRPLSFLCSAHCACKYLNLVLNNNGNMGVFKLVNMIPSLFA